MKYYRAPHRFRAAGAFFLGTAIALPIVTDRRHDPHTHNEPRASVEENLTYDLGGTATTATLTTFGFPDYGGWPPEDFFPLWPVRKPRTK